ncbi:FLYWCH-type domain-containing protein [Sergentomyia squamirostris]
MRGKDQVIYMGQPFIFDKYVQLTTGVQKKVWRCNQWWSQRCGELDVVFTKSSRGRPAILVNGIRYLVMTDSPEKTLWRCSYMASKKLKCPARVLMLKTEPSTFVYIRRLHKHAPLKRERMDEYDFSNATSQL